MTTARSTETEARFEAAMHLVDANSLLTIDDLVREYNASCDRMESEGGEPLTIQRWIEAAHPELCN